MKQLLLQKLSISCTNYSYTLDGKALLMLSVGFGVLNIVLYLIMCIFISGLQSVIPLALAPVLALYLIYEAREVLFSFIIKANIVEVNNVNQQ